MKKLEFPLVMHDKKSKIDFFLASRQKCFDVKDVMALYNSLLALEEERIDKLMQLQLVSPRTALLLSLFLGVLGVDRFYCRDYKLGVAKLFTISACGFWWLGDLFVIRDAARRTNYKILRNFIINPVKEEDAD
ncbi:MAG TPA: TM2 domain-containing protein [Firmicutes bacterium]|nr:TM2 domain-containing protein [Bacillota bacterium]